MFGLLKITNFANADRNAEARSRVQAGGAAKYKSVYRRQFLTNRNSRKILIVRQGLSNGGCPWIYFIRLGNDAGASFPFVYSYSA